jgi:hypothetical protein
MYMRERERERERETHTHTHTAITFDKKLPFQNYDKKNIFFYKIKFTHFKISRHILVNS